MVFGHEVCVLLLSPRRETVKERRDYQRFGTTSRSWGRTSCPSCVSASVPDGNGLAGGARGSCFHLGCHAINRGSCSRGP